MLICFVSIFHQPNSDYLQDYQSGMMVNSTKMFLLMHIIDMSVCIGDKILVYRCVCECVHVSVHVYLSVVFRLMGFEVLIQLLNLIVLITLCLPHCLTNQKDFILFLFVKKATVCCH